MFKLWLDSVKDLVLSAAALCAIILDIAKSNDSAPARFYGVMRFGEKIDRRINLYGTSESDAERALRSPPPDKDWREL